MANRPLPHLLDELNRPEPEREVPVVGSLADRVRALRLPSDEEMHSRGAARRWMSAITLAALLLLVLGGAYYAVQQGWLGAIVNLIPASTDSSSAAKKTDGDSKSTASQAVSKDSV